MQKYTIIHIQQNKIFHIEKKGYLCICKQRFQPPPTGVPLRRCSPAAKQEKKIMKIALIGYGKMGHAIESMAKERGHSIVCTIDTPQELAEKACLLKQADVAIEFSTPSTAAENIRHCLLNDIAIVCGTTGWYTRYDELTLLCHERGGALFTSTNFSIGMNIVFALNRKLARLMRGRNEYKVDITETHHIHKLDAPSGTAITIRDQIAQCGDRSKDDIPIQSVREGEIAGIHTIRYDSPVDTITLTHEAHSRQGLALGALLAAEFLPGHKGVYTMDDLLEK